MWMKCIGRKIKKRWFNLSMYKKVSMEEELLQLKDMNIIAFQGYQQSKIIITIQRYSTEKENLEYYFTNRTQYAAFYRKLRKITQ